MTRRLLNRALSIAAIIALGPLNDIAAFAAEVTVEPAAQNQATQVEPTLFVRMPADGTVAFRGTVSLDEMGLGSGGFLYPAPSFGGFLAAVFTHGVIVDSVKQGQKTRLQATADQVLVPYRQILDSFTYDDLMRRAIAKTSIANKARVVEQSAQAGPETVIETMPIFSMTQDQRAIVVDNLIAIRKPGATAESAYRSAIRVVSRDWNPPNPGAFWTSDGGERLKDESAQLVAESIDIALLDAARSGAEPEPVQKTVRYREGGTEKYERAQVLNERCDRILIRTLRGALMSIPPAPSRNVTTAAVQCGKDMTAQK